MEIIFAILATAKKMMGETAGALRSIHISQNANFLTDYRSLHWKNIPKAVIEPALSCD
jgi:hypothetical protein